MSNELKPCPFCGGEVCQEYEPQSKVISCADCSMTFNMSPEQWNTRPENPLQEQVDGNTSDGYHTFNELYHHRMCLFAAIVNQNRNISWKSKLHADGTMFDDYFIVGITTPSGNATYHYHIDHWAMFDCKELYNAPEWDGHTPDDVCKRLLTIPNTDLQAENDRCKKALEKIAEHQVLIQGYVGATVDYKRQYESVKNIAETALTKKDK